MIGYRVGEFNRVRVRNCDFVKVVRLQNFGGLVRVMGTDILNQLSILLALITHPIGACTELR